MHRIRRRLTTLLVAIVVATAAVPDVAMAETFRIDPVHTTVEFRIRHLLTKTTGVFRKFDGSVVFDPDDPDKVKVEGFIDVNSIDTGNAKRDDHLRGADFFNVEKYPMITFKAGDLEEVDAEKMTGKLRGELTMLGVTKPVVIDVGFYGTVVDPWGNKKAGFGGTTTLNRKDFGMVWNKALDAGGVVLGEDVDVSIQVEASY
jgi:polyisoprenoid-binding protein YceI